MKKLATLALGLILSSNAIQAQTEVLTGVMHGKEYGVTYMLPQTEIEILVHAVKKSYSPGEFNKYADQYLRIKDVSPKAHTEWKIEKIETAIKGVADKSKVYFVKLKDKTVAPLMELTEDGVIRSINVPFATLKKEQTPPKKVEAAEKEVDPRSFLTEEILMTTSSAKMADLIAKEIYSIRESKNALLRGEAENTPNDGVQLKLMLDHLELQEKALTEMFTGKHVIEKKIFKVRIKPEEMDNEVAFRFSKKLGFVDKENLIGTPTYISIKNLDSSEAANTNDNDKTKDPEGVAYTLPGKALITLTRNNIELYKEERAVSQFGHTEYLAPVLFNKNSTIQVIFDTTTGGLIKVEREVKK